MSRALQLFLIIEPRRDPRRGEPVAAAAATLKCIFTSLQLQNKHQLIWEYFIQTYKIWDVNLEI